MKTGLKVDGKPAQRFSKQLRLSSRPRSIAQIAQIAQIAHADVRCARKRDARLSKMRHESTISA
jgi:hypothetical protein